MAYGSTDSGGLTFVVKIKIFFLVYLGSGSCAPERSDIMNHIFTNSQPLV